MRLLLQNTNKSSSGESRLPPIELHSVFIKTAEFFGKTVRLLEDAGKAAKHAGLAPMKVIVGTEEVQSKVIGFPFCRGALACGKIPFWRDGEDWLIDFIEKHPRFSTESKEHDHQSPSQRLAALDGVCDTANLGSIVRCASAFGSDALILSNDSCDVWYRKSVRVSMGHVCRIPCVRVSSLSRTLQYPQNKLEIVSYAAVIDKDAECVLGWGE